MTDPSPEPRQGNPPADASPHAFSPPSPDKLSEHLSRWEPTPPPAWLPWLPWIVLGVALVLSLMIDTLAAAVLPWLALIGLMVWGGVRVRRSQALERAVNQLDEQTMLRRHRRALRDAWVLLPRLQHQPSLHGRAVAVMSHCLGSMGCYEQAMVTYNHLLSGMPDTGPATTHLRLSRAIAAMRCDHLVDADADMRRARGVMAEYRGTPLAAIHRLAQLVQDVQTHHFADALDFEPTLLDDLRPLGVEAGYGHALMALCCHSARAEDPNQMQRWRQLARQWWDRATTLISPSVLVVWQPELAALREPSSPAPKQDHG